MINAICIYKYRDRNKIIYGYKLQDANGKTVDVKPEALKIAIKAGQVNVKNLTLTSDGRLVDKAADSDHNGSIKKAENKVLPRKITYIIAPIYIGDYEDDYYRKINIRNFGFYNEFAKADIKAVNRKQLEMVLNKIAVLNAFKTCEKLDSDTLIVKEADLHMSIYKIADANTEYKIVSAINEDELADLIDDKEDLDLLAHPLNNMKNRTIHDGEIAYRLFIVKREYLNYLYGSTNCYIMLVEYNWRIMKSFIPIYNYLHTKKGVSEERFKEILKEIVPYDTNYAIIEETPEIYSNSIDKPEEDNSIPVSKIIDYYNNLKLNNITDWDMAEALYNIYEISSRGINEDHNSEDYDYLSCAITDDESRRKLTDVIGIPILDDLLPKWILVEYILFNTKDVDAMLYNFYDMDTNGYNYAIRKTEEHLVYWLIDNNKESMLRALKIIREYSGNLKSEVKDYCMQLDNTFLQSVIIYKAIRDKVISLLNSDPDSIIRIPSPVAPICMAPYNNYKHFGYQVGITVEGDYGEYGTVKAAMLYIKEDGKPEIRIVVINEDSKEKPEILRTIAITKDNLKDVIREIAQEAVDGMVF